jgi:hypothetical protein
MAAYRVSSSIGQAPSLNAFIILQKGGVSKQQVREKVSLAAKAGQHLSCVAPERLVGRELQSAR